MREPSDPIEAAIRECANAATRVISRVRDRKMTDVPRDLPELERWHTARAKLTIAVRNSGRQKVRAGPTIEHAGNAKAP